MVRSLCCLLRFRCGRLRVLRLCGILDLYKKRFEADDLDLNSISLITDAMRRDLGEHVLVLAVT